MKTYLVIGIIAAATLATIFAPHHRRQDVSFNPRTLAGIYGGLFSGLAEAQGPRLPIFILFMLAGLLSAVYPVLLMLMIHAAGQQFSDGFRTFLVLAGVICLGGALVNLVLMLMSGMTIGFGTSTSTGEGTAFIWLVPAFQATFALASIVIGISSTCAHAAWRVL